MSLSGIYRILTSPFYTGLLHWDDQTYAGKHEPAVTQDEFERIQRLLCPPCTTPHRGKCQ